MKKIIVSIVLTVAATAAFAACPPYAPYGCQPYGTKMICGCGK